jgi:type IV secretion system protein VirD4
MKFNKNYIQWPLIVAFIFLLGYVFVYLAAILLLMFHAKFDNILQVSWHTWFDAMGYYPTNSKSFQIAAMSGFMSFALIFLAPFAVIFSKQNKNANIHGNARFASEKEIEKEGLFKQVGIFIGKYAGKYLFFGGNEFVYLAAPTRSGKGVSLIIANCILWFQSMIVNDIKGENYSYTGAYRKYILRQKVFYFNPWLEKTHRFNPFFYVSRDPNLIVKDLNFMGLCLYPEDPKNPFWSQQACALFIGLSLLVLETKDIPHTLGEVLRQGTGYGKSCKDHVEEMLSKGEYSTSCRGYLGRFLSNSDDVMKNILSSFFAPLQIWDSPLIDNATSANDFDFGMLRREKMTIYLHTAAGDVGQVAVVLNLLFSFALRQNIDVLPEQDASLKHNCLLLMDEFPAIGKIDIILKSVGYIAGYGMRLFLVCQNYPQLELVYGKDGASNLYSNMGMRIFFAPDEYDDAKYLSDSLGTKTTLIHNESVNNKDKPFSGQVSRSENSNLSPEKLMEPDELMAMGTSKALLQRVGMRFFLFDRIKYFNDPLVSPKFFSMPFKIMKIDGEERKVPHALPLPDSKLAEHFASLVRVKTVKEVDIQAVSQGTLDSFFAKEGLTVAKPAPAKNIEVDFKQSLVSA